MKHGLTMCTKMSLGVSAFLALILLMGGGWWLTVDNLSDELDGAVRVTAKRLDLVGAMKARVQEMGSLARAMQLASSNGAPEQAAVYAKKFETVRARVYEQIREQRALGEDEQRTRLLQLVEDGARRWEPLHAEFSSLVAQAKYGDAYRLMTDKILSVMEQMQDAAQTLTEAERKGLAAARAEAVTATRRSRLIALALLALGIATAVTMAIMVNRIKNRLRQALDDIARGATQVAEAAAQVSTASQSLAQGTTEQAASIEQTSAAAQEMRNLAQHNSESSQAASELVAQSEQRSAQAHQTLDLMVKAISEIDESSTKMAKIIKVIDEIAFQTNILALNAAVEAARAGEAGMGFAVVADEVRNLAQRCAQAAEDVTGLIEGSIQKSHQGQSRVGEAQAAIHSITADAERTRTLVGEVSTGSRDQAHGLDQVFTAIREMEQVTQTTAASSEECAAAAEQLTALSTTVRNIVHDLAAMIHKSAEPSRCAPARSRVSA